MNGTPLMNDTPKKQRDRASLCRRKQRARQAKLEQEIEAFFRSAGVKHVDLSEMFQR